MSSCMAGWPAAHISVALDGSTDTAQFLLNVRAVNSNFELTQELTDKDVQQV